MRRLVFFASLVSQFFAVTAPAAVEVTDDRGVVLRRASPAQRVIALAPHLTELVFAAGAGNRLVGKVRGSDFPPEAQALAEVGDAAGLHFECILASRPDLVLAWGSGNRIADVERLERLGFAVLVLEPRQLEDIPRHMRMPGVLLGTGGRAQAAALAFVSRADRLRERYRGKPAVSMLFEAWQQPLITVNGEHLISDVLRLCGARNAFGDLPQLAAAVSPEQVLAADPVPSSSAPKPKTPAHKAGSVSPISSRCGRGRFSPSPPTSSPGKRRAFSMPLKRSAPISTPSELNLKRVQRVCTSSVAKG